MAVIRDVAQIPIDAIQGVLSPAQPVIFPYLLRHSNINNLSNELDGRLFVLRIKDGNKTCENAFLPSKDAEKAGKTCFFAIISLSLLP